MTLCKPHQFGLRWLAIVALLAGLAPLAAAQTAPTVAISSPVPGATICGTFTVSATASSVVGIAGVQFKYDGIDLTPEATSVPYTARAYTHNVANGSYTLTAVARDTLGNVTTSAPVPVTVANGSPYVPCDFIPTFLVYYGGGPTLTYADAPKLATFDLFDTDRARYCELSSNCDTWSAIRNYNSDIGIYLYELGPEATNYNDSTEQVGLDDIARYNNSRGHSMGSLNGDHPELFLLDSGGSRIYNVPTRIPAPTNTMDI